MTIDSGSIKQIPQVTDAVTGATGTDDKGGDNLHEFRVPSQDVKASGNTEPYSGEGSIAAGVSGALMGIGSRTYGPYMREAAANAFGYQYAKDGFFSEITHPIDARLVGKVLESAPLPPNLTFSDKVALEASQALKRVDATISNGLMRTATNSGWAPEATLWKAGRNGAIAGVSDWAVDRGLEWATGAESLRPNVIETSLVAGAIMSPIPGRYKAGAVAVGWGIGKLSNIIGLT